MTLGRMWDDVDDTRAYETTLRVTSGAVPDHAVNWEAFHTRLSARAELSLARLRHPRPTLTVTTTHVHAFPRRVQPQRRSAWWQHTARWSPAVVTGALAASVVLVAAIRTMPKESPTPSTNVVASTAGGERSRAAFESAIVGHASASSTASTFLPSAADLLIPLGEVTR